jgi:hypothetical protein
MKKTMLLTSALAAGAMIAVPAAMADEWPTRPLTMVIGFNPGGSTDIQGRVLANVMEEYLGQPVNVVNQPGAGSAVAFTNLANNTDEGYTFLYGGTTALTFTPIITEVEYEIDDFEYLAALALGQNAIVTSAEQPFETFDQIIEHHACERIKTIGDAYLAVANMPSSNPEHATDIATAAIKILRYLERRNAQHDIQWTCRVGIHTGSVVGSVVGVRKYIYDVFGDGVNTASRMQSLSEPMKITVSEPTFKLIRSTIPCIPRGEFEIKGADKMNVYFIDTGISD